MFIRILDHIGWHRINRYPECSNRRLWTMYGQTWMPVKCGIASAMIGIANVAVWPRR
jgi:hypothetical protein